MKPIDFWIEYGSTYTYLSVARIGRMAAASNVEIRWQPFFVMPIMAEHGLTQGPFLPFPTKTAYMWRDIERRALKHETPYAKPSTYPVSSLLTARIACIAADEGWCQPFTEGVFRLHWTRNILIGSDENLCAVLTDLGQSPSTLIERAKAQVVKDKLKLQTERAKLLGIFGAPSFTVDQELFWGDDRLAEAIEWARTH
jgi:2-hydroxychromene-2-carboxylate isomerase